MILVLAFHTCHEEAGRLYVQLCYKVVRMLKRIKKPARAAKVVSVLEGHNRSKFTMLGDITKM